MPDIWKADDSGGQERVERLYTMWVRISDAREECRRTNKQAVADSSEGYIAAERCTLVSFSRYCMSIDGSNRYSETCTEQNME